MAGQDLIPRPGNGAGTQLTSQSVSEVKAASPSKHQRFDTMGEPSFMITDVVGKVNNTNLPKNKALLPLFEAIVNSGVIPTKVRKLS